MAESSKSGVRARPMSPHLQIWRWHVTMATSILHRATGVANAVGLLILITWIGSLAAGEEAYGIFTAIAGSFLGRLIIFGCLVSNAYHIINGIRHLLFNLGVGLDKECANKTAWVAIIGGVIGGIILFILGLMAVGR